MADYVTLPPLSDFSYETTLDVCRNGAKYTQGHGKAR